MKSYNTFLIFLIMVSACFRSWSQAPAPDPSGFSKTVDVLPPSPNAASLGKYGGMDLSLSSGLANVNIPIYNYTSSNLILPIGLSYTSNGGLKVDEIAGRAGTGWSINAGGVITRTVYGAYDESATRSSIPTTSPLYTTRDHYNWMYNISNGDVYGPLDSEPDVFSFNFNGHVGRFILDANLNPMLLKHANLKIERDFSGTNWNFKISTDDGVQYFFGGGSARERTLKTASDECRPNAPEYVPTAWYLNKIIHPNNDTITFTYTPISTVYSTGLMQSMFAGKGLDEACPGKSPPVSPNLSTQNCENIALTSGVLLQEINGIGGGKIKFTYVNRSDGNDKLLSNIEIFKPGETTYWKAFLLTYQNSVATTYKNSFSLADPNLCNRPFLMNLTEKSSDALLTKTYSFTYKDMNSLPPRLSYAQDDFGYFNGKSNNTLIPRPDDLLWRSKLPNATADGSVDPDYAQRGLLATVIYPTGGKDSIVYEGNQAYKLVTTYPTPTTVNTYATKPYNPSVPYSLPTIVYSAPIVIGYSQLATLASSCEYIASDHLFPEVSRTKVEIIDQSDNSVDHIIEPYAGDSYNEIISLTAGKTYKIKSSTYGNNVSGGATLTCTIGTPTSQNMNVNTGGVRLYKVITTDGLSNVFSVKKYLYNELSTPNISSGSVHSTPLYKKITSTYGECSVLPPIDEEDYPYPCHVWKYDFYALSANSNNNIYRFSGSPISYRHVVESFGDNFENGGIEHEYTVSSDQPGTTLIGDEMLAVPLTSYAWRNAREVHQYVFKKQGVNYVPVKEIFTHYKEDSRKDQEIKAYLVNRKFDFVCTFTGPPSSVEQMAYDFYTYSHFIKWIYVDTVRTWTYDNSGQTYTEDVVFSEYDNPTHALPTKQSSYASDGSIKSTINTYPQDIVLTGSQETARQALISKHMIGSLLQQQINKDATSLFKLKTAYNVFPNTMVLRQADSVQIGSYPMTERRRFYSYNNSGKMLEQSLSNDVRHSYVWNDLNTYPIAKVVNASPSDIAYSSFESYESGNWTIGSALRSVTEYMTGKQGYALSNGNISKSGLTAAKTYTVSYWSKNGSYTVSGSSNTKAGSTINGWTYYQHVVSGQTTITVSGSGYIDELRLYVSESEMITYAYSPLIGLITECDVNNKISHYEYDGLGRLKVVRDQDGNIIKSFEYEFQQPL